MRAVLLALTFSVLAAGQQQFVARVPMRDGVRLSTNIFLPAAEGVYPTLLVRTPYNKGKDLIPNYRVFLDRGFAIVVQDVRGRYASGGVFRAFSYETQDGDDTINWIARQPWSDGKVGMLGGSYVGIAQWRAAISRNPHLIAIFPLVSGGDEYMDRYYSRGGALKLGHRLLWLADNLRAPGYPPAPFWSFVEHLPLRTSDRAATGRTLDLWQDAMNHPSYDQWWRSRSTMERVSLVRAPAFIVGGWYDNYVESDVEMFAALRRYSTAHRLVVGPWGHSMSEPFASGITFGPQSGSPIRRYQLDWFTHWMQNPQPAPEFTEPPVQLFVMGLNRWRDEYEWPLARTQYKALYLTSRIAANTMNGDGALVWQPERQDQDRYTYDPRNPVDTAGGAICCNARVFPPGPMDQRRIEMRDDVLVYTSPRLPDDLEVTGPVRVVLYVSTTAPDTDFTAKLVDVFPDGHARNLCDGILRLRFRDGLSTPRLAKPGQRYRIEIPAGVTSNVFLAGHRIRLEVSSSNFPRFDRNPNTGRAVADERELRVARQTVFHGRETPSHIVLPVIPARGTVQSGNRR